MLPQVNTQVTLPQGFHRGATIGSIGGVIAAAGQLNGVTYDTKTKRVIRLKMASQMIKPVTSFNDLTDRELQGMFLACSGDVDSIAQWLGGQDFPCTPLRRSKSASYMDDYVALEDPLFGDEDDYW